jgi:hypothetical protein
LSSVLYYPIILLINKKMNLKKLLILPVGFILTNFMYIACCKCPAITSHYVELINIGVNPLGSGNAIIDKGTPTTVDTIYLNYSLNTNCVVKQKNNFSFLVNTANACDCISCGDKGLKNGLVSFNITSNNIYNGIPADQPLNALFSVKRNYYLNSDYSIDSLTRLIKSDNFINYNYTFFTKTKPGNTSGHKFTLTMSFVNGSAVTSVTNPIIWQ